MRCPCCGRGPVYRHWLRMYHECPLCGLNYYREPGYYVGAMILNYLATTLILTAAYLLSLWVPVLWHASPQKKITVWLAVAVAMSLGFVAHARSLWLAVDYWIEPWPPKEEMFRRS